MLTRRLAGAAALLAITLLLALAGPAAGAAPRVTVVSDSVLTAVTWNGAALSTLGEGLDLQIDAGVCRRLNGQSCQFNGTYVPTTLQVLNGWINALGPVVVIVDGYNDLPDSFAGDVELTLDTLRDHGVQHVLWVNLHEVRPEYVQKNAVLAAAARHHPELRLLDWNTYSSSHPDWYQSDLIHLQPAGGAAIAAWLHQAILDALAPTPAPAPAQRSALVVKGTRTLVARVGRTVDRRLQAAGGVGRLQWVATGRALRRAKLHLLAGGEVRGRPTRPGTYGLQFRVTDETGSSAQVTIRLTVRPRRR